MRRRPIMSISNEPAEELRPMNREASNEKTLLARRVPLLNKRHETRKCNIYTIKEMFLNVVFNIFIPSQLHWQIPTNGHSYKSPYGKHRHNGGPKECKPIFRYLCLVTLAPGLVYEVLHILEIRKDVNNSINGWKMTQISPFSYSN